MAVPTDQPAFVAWLKRVNVHEGPFQAEERHNGPMERVPAEYIRRAIVGHLEGKWLIRSVIRATNTCFEGDLYLKNLEIPFPLYFIECVFEGAIHASGAKTKTLNFRGSTLREGADLRNLRIDGHLFLRRSFQSLGPLLLRDMKIDGTIDLTGGSFLYRSGGDLGPFSEDARGDCIGLSRTEATALLWVRNAPTCAGSKDIDVTKLRPQGLVTLRDLKVRAFRHDLNQPDWSDTWPEPGNLVLDGFTYERIDDAPREVFLKWLELQNKDKPHEAPATIAPKRPVPSPAPYFQLASVLEKQGRKDHALRIRAQVRRNDVLGYAQPKRFIARAFFWPVDYGASPWRALGLMLALFVAFVASIGWLNTSGRMAPAAVALIRDTCYYGSPSCQENLATWQKLRLAKSFPTIRYVPPDYPRMSPLEYGLETFVPLFNFGQRQYWAPASSAMRLALALIAFLGIFLGSLFAAAVSGLLMPRSS